MTLAARALLAGALLLLLSAGIQRTVFAAPVEVAELWTGTVYTSTYRIGICFSSEGKVRGVMHLRTRKGDVDVYHFYGTVKDNEVMAAHSSGQRFRWRLVSAKKVEGEIVLTSGRKIALDGERHHDALLAPEDCAPLRE
jgi:hypothetical protein